MKKILFILAITGLVFSSCGNKKKQDNSGTHVHEDGTIHANDAHNQDAKPNQESFEVKADNDAEHKHPHGDGDEKGHKHENGDGDREAAGHDKDEHGHEHGDQAGHDNDHEHGEHK